jgi:hypothetical protein
MIIRSASKDYFYWQFDEKEKELPESRELIEKVKSKIPANGGRYYIKDRQCWAINKQFFHEFIAIMNEYYYNLCFKQGELF